MFIGGLEPVSALNAYNLNMNWYEVWESWGDASPSLSFSLSSFLLFLLDDLLWEDWEAPVCPALPEPPPENDEEEEEELASTLLPHKAQESSCKSTGETPSSTRKLTWRRKYNTAKERRQTGKEGK